MTSHLFWMVLHATLLSGFLSVLWRSERRARIKFFAKAWTILVIGSIALAWVMYWMPGRSPIQFPG